ncbi:MAG: DUF1292 domain-containing protein [Acutalibacteraceae bacterium]|jgi:uncharacterized protein YrzB (UPF0473 family)|nr:DUF1292 domain-containing protein [Clostridiales bacterium]
MDNEYNPDIITVVDEDGKEHIFEELDRIETDEGRYVALIPVYDDSEEILDDDGELIILRVIEENGEPFLTAIEDFKEFEKIGKIFQERLEEMFEITEEE